jgi:hypothetical protein
MAHRRMKDAGADEARTKTWTSMEATALMEVTQSFIAQHETLPSLWPIVSCVSIAMGSELLKNAIELIDLPGKRFMLLVSSRILTAIGLGI